MIGVVGLLKSPEVSRRQKRSGDETLLTWNSSFRLGAAAPMAILLHYVWTAERRV